MSRAGLSNIYSRVLGALLVATGLMFAPAFAEPSDWVYAPLLLENEPLTLARNPPLAALFLNRVAD